MAPEEDAMEPVSSTVAALGTEAAKTAGGLMGTMLEPVVKLMGEDLAAAYTRRNLKRIAEKAAVKADGRGIASARVAKAVIDAAGFADGPVLAEYLSGVLASSTAVEGGDDSGLPWLKLVERLSSDQLLLHYVLHEAFRRAWGNAPIENDSDLTDGRLYGEYFPVMLFTTRFQQRLRNDTQLHPKVEHNMFQEALYGLRDEGLIGDVFRGSQAYLQERTGCRVPDAKGGGLTFVPTYRGIGLFLRAAGFSSFEFDRFHDAVLFEDDELSTEAGKVTLLRLQ
jgi:hypothetical protein